MGVQKQKIGEILVHIIKDVNCSSGILNIWLPARSCQITQASFGRDKGESFL